MPETVYVLTNPAMPGYVKIGYTTNIQARMKQLHSTGVPEPFECAMAMQVETGEGRKLEKALHTAFIPDKGSSSREFFKMDPERVVAILRIWPGKDVTPTPASPKTPTKARTPATPKKRRPGFTFDMLGIPVGSTLVFTRTGEEATVIENNRVQFRGKEMSLTAATQLLFGYHTHPTPHWKFEGRTLQEMYEKAADSQT